MLFTQDWLHCHDIVPTWKRLLKFNQSITMLEIGCFEGLSTLWFLQNLPLQKIVVVDTFEGDDQLKDMGVSVNSYDRFMDNTKEYRQYIELYKGTSQAIVPQLTDRFDCIYIDGAHDNDSVSNDAENSLCKLNQGGILIFNAYGMRYTTKGGVLFEPREVIDAFVKAYGLTIISKGWQLLVRKQYERVDSGNI